MSKETNSSEKNPRPRSSRVYFFSELPQIATCHECTVLVPVPKKSKVHLFRRKKSELSLHSFGSCTILLLESDAQEDVVNFSGDENQTPLMTIYLNRLIDKSLEHIVEKSKVWQEFHLNDQGRKRSFVLQFPKGPEFDKFYPKLQNVINTLNVCRESKAKMNKKYILVGFKHKEPDEFIQTIKGKSSSESGISDNSCSSDTLVHRPYNPPPHVTRVTGLDQALEKSKSTQSVKSDVKIREGKYYKERHGPKSAPQSCELLQTVDDPAWTVDFRSNIKTPEEKYNKERNGSLSSPQSCELFLQTADDPAWIVDIELEIGDRETMIGDKQTLKVLSDQHENLEKTLRITEIDTNTENSENVDKQIVKVLSDQHENLEKTLRITDIDTNTENSENVDMNNDAKNIVFSEGFNISDTDFECTGKTNSNIADDNNLLPVCAENLTMKAKQDQNQSKHYTQLLHAAINDGDQEKARQYADILAASHVKGTVLLNDETNEQDINFKKNITPILVFDSQTSASSFRQEATPQPVISTHMSQEVSDGSMTSYKFDRSHNSTLNPENRLQFPQQYFQEQRARSMPEISMQSQQYDGYGVAYHGGYSGSAKIHTLVQPVSGD
ncbi:uncharacterized protein LOC127735034 [Mytilus californianus]|uniref:uncharacterized protein LOC127735034 n=1 Tax=Mytilus californianus TaxID=6549 RepID=UPI0022473CD0|nr:uncharacterized protein LOC127735034 [Mytilus californianus]